MNRLNRLYGALLWGALLLSTPACADPLQDANKLFKQGNAAQALEKVEQVLADKPKDAAARFLKGLILTEQNKSDEAIKIFTALNEDFPELPEPYNNLAVLYAGQGQYEKAKTSLEMAIHAHPSYVTAHENLGDIYAKLASQSYDRALQLDHSNMATKGKLATIQALFQEAPRPKSRPVKTNDKAATPAAVIAAPIIERNAFTAVPSVASSVVAASTVAAVSEVVAIEPVVVATSAVVVTSAVVAAPTAADLEKAAQKARSNEVMTSVNAWVSAWENKQTKKYVAFYAHDFQPSQKGLTRAKWAEQRKNDIEDSKNIQISISRANVTFKDDNHATVKFQQSLKFGKMRKAKLSRKTLTMVKSGNKWLILEEKAK